MSQTGMVTAAGGGGNVGPARGAARGRREAVSVYPSSQIPPVPVGTMPATAQLVVTAVLAVLAAGAVGFAVSESRRTGSPLPPAILVGGALAAFNEPIVDVLGGCVHHQIGQWTAFTTFDRPMPVWLCLAYVLYFGTGPLAILRAMSRLGPRSGFSLAVSGLL